MFVHARAFHYHCYDNLYRMYAVFCLCERERPQKKKAFPTKVNVCE